MSAVKRWIEYSIKELWRPEIRTAMRVVESDASSETSDDIDITNIRVVEETSCGAESIDEVQEKDVHLEPKVGQDDGDEERHAVYAIFPEGHPLHRCAEPKDDEKE